jgi:hypothetical protein
MQRIIVLAALALVALLALAGCGPRVGAGELAAAAAPEDAFVDLPALYVDYGADGMAMIGGAPATVAGAMLGQDLSMLNLGPEAVAAMSGVNIQHVQINNTPNGLVIAVNGRRMPSLAWDGAVLTGLGDLIGELGVPLGGLEQMLSILPNTGFGFVLRFPVAEGRDVIPLADPNAQRTAEAAQAAVDQYLAGVGGQVPVIQFTVNYRPDGTWTVQDMDAAAWEQVLPIGWDGFNLSPAMAQGAAGLGLRTLGVSTDKDGIAISINDRSLPKITWGQGELENILTLLEESGALDMASGGGADVQGLVDMVKQLLPTVQTADFNMTVNFPAP